MTTMTPAQGRFLTSLLDDLTAVAPAAGTEARVRIRATFAAGNLTKAEASRSIDVLKRAIALAKGTAPVPAPAREVSVVVARNEAFAARTGQAITEVVYLQDGTLQIAATALAPRAEISEREAVMLEARRAQAATLRKGKPTAKRRASARPAGGGLMDSLRTWTPERSAALLADTEGLPF